MSKTDSETEISQLPFMNMDLDLEERVEDLLNRLTLEEKFTLSSGKRVFWAKPVKRLGIPSFKMTDGPHGLGAAGTFFMKKSTYFPSAICRTASWDIELAHEYAVAVAEEIRDVGYHMSLSPGINIQRTPLGGRNFEYQTEDPYLNTVMAVATVKGFQSQRIAACVKHYAVNNQEWERFKVDAILDERTLQEIYLPAYEACVREADAWSFMNCYNRVNGVYGSCNKNLLRERLMDEWGFRGFVVTDWFASRWSKTADCVNAGLTLEMPIAIAYKVKRLKKALAEGKFTEETFNGNFKRFLRVMFLTGVFDDESTIPKGSRNTPEHQALARKIAEESMVLLKNENDILPLDINNISKIAVVGPNANKKMAFSGGSSMIRSFYEITPLQGLKTKCKGKIKIIKNPSKADIAIVVAGLNHGKHMDRENKDRRVLELPEDQIELINETVKQNPKTIVVLVNGSPIAMDGWLENVNGVVEAWYGGMEGGNVIANILFGDVNPSGKLPITFPKRLSDSPAHATTWTYPGVANMNIDGKIVEDSEDYKVYHEEGIFVGYRHFDSRDIEPLFPFGFGLSYTTFKYDNLKVDKASVSGDDTITVSFDITNTGNREGAEIAQLYIHDVECSVERPFKELKGFKRVFLNSGEKETVEIKLDKKALSYYDVETSRWKVEPGEFKFLIGASSRDIFLEGTIIFQ